MKKSLLKVHAIIISQSERQNITIRKSNNTNKQLWGKSWIIRPVITRPWNGVLQWQTVAQALHEFYWKLKVNYRVLKSLSLFPVLSHTNPIHFYSVHLIRNNFKIIFHLCLGFQRDLLPLDLMTKTSNISTIKCVLHAQPLSSSLVLSH
jgi:hypothetical protein